MISKLEICDPIQLCVISEGYECVNKLGTILANYDRSNDKDALCMGRLKSQECVDEFVFKCSDAKAKPVKDAFKKLFDKVNDTCKDIELPPAPICPAIPERNRVCYLGNSFRCLADLNIKYLNTGDSLIWRRQCLEIQSMMVCVATNTTSCDAESGDVKAIRESLKDIRTTAYGQCPWMSDDLCSNEEICPVVNAGCEVDLERGMINGEKTVCELKQLADECIQRNTVTCNHAQKTQANNVLEKKLQALGFSKDLSCDNSSYDGCLYSFLSAARDIYVDSRRNVSCQLLQSQYNCIAMKISNPNNSSFIDLARNLLSELSKKLIATPCTVNVSSSCSQIPVRKLSELITQLLLNVQLHTTSFCAQSLAIIQEQKTGDCNSGLYDIIQNSSAFQQKCVGEVPSCLAAKTKIEECLGGNSASSCLDQKGARCISQYLPVNCTLDKTWYTQLCEHTVLLQVNGQQSSKNFISEAGLHSRFSWLFVDGYRHFRMVMSAQPINSSTVPSCLQGSQVNDPIPQVCSDSNPKTLGNSSNEIAFNIYARQDYRMDGPQSVKLEFTVIPYRNVTNTTSGNETYEDLLGASFKLTYIIEVDDTDALRSMCSSINDPHITTYDGFKYNNMNSGLYILHRHIKEAIAVLVQYQQCAAHGTCNCAVHVMAEKCKLSIDLCNPNTPLISFDAPKGTKDLPISLFVEKDQKTYSVVCLATGTIIKVVVDDPYMNVWILPSAADRGNAGGQCGDNNGDGNNDFQLPDSSRYILVPGDSQFGVISPDFYNNAWKVSNASDLASIFAPGVQITTEPLPEYCYLWSNSSTGTKPTCHQSAHLTTCGYVTGEDQSNKLLEMMNQMTSTGSKRKKRQAVAQEEEIVNTTRVAPGWPTPTGWTLEKATEYCMDNLYNPSLEACRETVLAMDETLKSFSLDDALRVCIDDIRLSDSTSWIQGARQVATQICIEEINRNPEYQKQTKTSDLAIAFMNTTCLPYDCSGKGKCYKGICLCDKDYVGTGCELSVGQVTPPTLTQPDEGVHMCEITATSDCSSIYITGKGFVGSSYLSCHIQEVEVAESGMRDVTSKITVVRADLLGTDLVRCDLGTKSTIKRSVKVSVSNDGKTPYPTYQYFIAYDPVCYECTMYSCIKNTDVCFIGTTCVSEGKRSVYSECQYCDLKNPNKWSIDTGITGCKEDDNKHTTETMDVTTKALIAAGVTLLVLLIILVVALFVYYKRRDAARKREARQMHRHDNQAYQDHPPFYGQPVTAINTKPSSVKNNLLGLNSP
ncbi:unnamed protein product [Lymnaea stagnalis]|uniref:VWFD domain-containing protein n=1 Tax=Lymnaea stagnalis TaxID=6523 RepID=A0AAV2HB59_LYMST